MKRFVQRIVLTLVFILAAVVLVAAFLLIVTT